MGKEREPGNMKSTINNVLGAVIGLAVFLVANYLLILIIALLGNIPILGSLLFYPSDAGWAIVTIPYIFSVYIAAIVAKAIAKTCRPAMVLVFIALIICVISLFVLDRFKLSRLISFIVGMGTSVIMFAGNNEIEL